jgi:hypothetical protein
MWQSGNTGEPVEHFSHSKQVFGWARIAKFVRWIDDRTGMLVAAKLQRCAGGACGAGNRTARRDDLTD